MLKWRAHLPNEKNQTRQKNHEQENRKDKKPAFNFESSEPKRNRERGNYTNAMPMALQQKG